MGKAKKLHAERGQARDFIGGTEHVCPFGTLAERNGEVAYGRIEEGRVEKSIKKALEAMLEGKKKTAVLMFPENGRDFEESKADAIRYMVAAGTILTATLYPDVTPQQIREALEIQVAAVIRDENSNKTPHLAAIHPITGVPDHIFTIFMGPCYQRPHARWAPYPMLVLTWAVDVQQVSLLQAEIVNAIHAKIRRIHGGRYDADLLVVPQVPDVVE